MAQDLNRSIKIYIDNSDAMANAGKLEKKISELRAELSRLSAEGKKNDQQYIATEKALKKHERSYSNYQNIIRETARVLKNLSGATYKELIATKKVLRNELQKEQRGTELYTEKLKSHNAIQKQITIAQKEMNGTLGAQGTLMSRAANGFNKYFGMITTGLATITGISFTFRKLSQDAAQMEDTYADVMKTTGMTRDEVGDLNEEFKKMDTRTAREELNMLARDAGKLGLQSKKDVLDFVEAGNQINVALGEDLGEGAIRNIGKMSEIFRNSTRELDQMDLKGRMLSIGSAINELGQSSTASEAYLVNFTQRLGGVASQAGISIQNVLGYASALDQSGQAVEMSATALQKFIMKLMGEPEKFARMAGLEVKKFNNLLKNDTNEAIKIVLKSLSEKGGFQQLIPLFQEMGLDGARAVQVLTSLAANIEKVDKAQQISNKAFAEAVSLTNEYNIKNNNAAAQLEKRKKAFKDAAEELGKRLNPALLKSTNYVTYMVKLLPGFLDFLGKYGKYIFYLVTAYAAYTAGVKLSVMWNTKFKEALTINNLLLKAKAAYLGAARLAMLAYNVVLGLVTGNFTMMRRAWILLTTSMSTNPIGMIAVAATAAVAGIIKLVQWLNRTSEATKAIKEATKQYNSELANETREANALFQALKKYNPESNTHLQIRKEIISKYGKYLQGLIDEKGNITDISKAIAAVNNGLREQIALKIRNTATDKITEDSLNKQTEITDKIMKRIGKQVSSETIRSSIRETINRTISEFDASGNKDYAQLQQKLLSDIQQTYGVDAYKGMRNVKNVVSDLVNELRESGKAVDEVKQKFSGMISEMTDVSSVIQTGPGDDPDGPDTIIPGINEDKKKNKKALESFEEAHKQKLLALKKQLLEENKTEKWFAEESVKIQQQYFVDKIALQKKLGESTVDTEIQHLDYILDLRKTADEKLLVQLNESRDSMLLSLDEYISLERNKLQDQVDDGIINRNKYNSELIALDLYAAQQRLNIASQHEDMIREADFEANEAKKKALEEAVKATKKATEEETKALEKSNKDKLKLTSDFEKEREQILSKYDPFTAKQKYEKELDVLDDYHKNGLLKEDEYQRALFQIKMKYYADYAEKAVSFANYVSDAVSSYHKAEADNLEAQKQRELSAAGSNAEKREEIEKKYAEKELNLKKKQANADAAVKIAQSISAGALAVMQAYAQLGPIAGSAAAALLAVTTAAQVASILAQRKAIMATTLDGSSGSSISGSGARVVNQRARGKYDVIGADDNRYYPGVPYVGPARTGFVSTPTLMGEAGRELVVSSPDLIRLQRHINYPLVIKAINDARTGVVPQRASGNYSQIPAPANPSPDMAILHEVRDLLYYLKNNGVKAPVVLSELQRKQELLNTSQKIGSK